MTTIDIQFNVEALGKSLEDISAETEATLNAAISSLATGAYSEVIRLANERLKSTRQDYINSLEFESIGDNIYVITLKGDSANATEDGYAPFDMKPGLLNGPNAQTTSKGTRFNTVPFRIEPKSKAPASSKMTDMRMAVNKLIKDRSLDKIITDPSGQPKEGIVARLTNTGVKDLEGLVKIQKNYQNTTQSTYMTFRRVSDNSDPNAWKHPGYPGAAIFRDVEIFIERELDNILKAIL